MRADERTLSYKEYAFGAGDRGRVLRTPIAATCSVSAVKNHACTIATQHKSYPSAWSLAGSRGAVLDWADPFAKIFSQRFSAPQPDGRRRCRRKCSSSRVEDTCKCVYVARLCFSDRSPRLARIRAEARVWASYIS